jgi:hypothetical protein
LFQKSGAAALTASVSSALRAAFRSKVAAERQQSRRGGLKGGDEIVAIGHMESRESRVES